MNQRSGWATLPGVVFGTSFIEGASVLIVEIAGARVLAPYYGMSLVVWTSQITATLLFLALGYLGGGRLSRDWKAWHLPALFGLAGLWLCVLPMFRNALLESTAHGMGIAAGSFLASSVLFGLPLACFGAISPVLIEHWNRVRPGAGRAAGLIFFINTLGGLVGAWLTALVLVPHLPMRVAMGACGVLLVVVAAFWYLLLVKKNPVAPAAALLLALLLTGLSPKPARSIMLSNSPVQVLYRSQSSVGLVQVLDMNGVSRTLLIDGITQGGIDVARGYSRYEFTEYLNVLSHGYHPKAKDALVLGMGSGALARQLHARGLNVVVVELEQKIVDAARNFFGLPLAVRTVVGDARATLRKLPENAFDLVFLDAFAGESVPWYGVTKEGLTEMQERLKPDGKLMINMVTRTNGSPGLARLEASMLAVFDEAKVHIEPTTAVEDGLVNATLVAGSDLRWHAEAFPGKINPAFWDKIGRLRANARDAQTGAPVGRDDWSDMDYADAALRERWRELVINALPADLLSD